MTDNNKDNFCTNILNCFKECFKDNFNKENQKKENDVSQKLVNSLVTSPQCYSNVKEKIFPIEIPYTQHANCCEICKHIEKNGELSYLNLDNGKQENGNFSPDIVLERNGTLILVENKRFYTDDNQRDKYLFFEKNELGTFKKWEPNNNSPHYEPYFKKNCSELLTFFKEGQLWFDVVRLLLFKKALQSDDRNIKLYLIGYIPKYHTISSKKKKDIDSRLQSILKKLNNKLEKDQLIRCYYIDNRNGINLRSLCYQVEDNKILKFSSREIDSNENFFFYAIKIEENKNNSRTSGCT